MNTYTLHSIISTAIKSMEEKAAWLQCTYKKEEVTTDISVRNFKTLIEFTMPVYRGAELEGDVYTFIECYNDTITAGDVIFDPQHQS